MRKIDFNLLLTHKKLEAFSYAQGSVIGLYQMNVLSQFVTSQPDLASEKYGAVPAKGRAYDHDIYIPKQNPSGVLNKMPADLKNDSTLTNLERIEQSIQYNSKPYNTIVLNASHYADLFSSSGNEYEKGMLAEKYSEAGLKKEVLETTSQDSDVGQGDPKNYFHSLINKELQGRSSVSSAELVNISKKLAPLVLPKDYGGVSSLNLDIDISNLDVD